MKERYRLITELLQMCEGYVAPSDYKPPKKHVKIFIPESAEINYIGQIIGPGGQTQRKLEKESHCKIQIRGEGSQNKGSMSAATAARMFERELLDADNDANNEPLHVYLTANSDEHLKVGEAMINAILRQTEEGKNWALMTYDHAAVKRVWCENCGHQGHKFFQCPEKIMSHKTNVVCQFCFATSHPTNDCPKRHGMRAIGGIDPKSHFN